MHPNPNCKVWPPGLPLDLDHLADIRFPSNKKKSSNQTYFEYNQYNQTTLPQQKHPLPIHTLRRRLRVGRLIGAAQANALGRDRILSGQGSKRSTLGDHICRIYFISFYVRGIHIYIYIYSKYEREREAEKICQSIINKYVVDIPKMGDISEMFLVGCSRCRLRFLQGSSGSSRSATSAAFG